MSGDGDQALWRAAFKGDAKALIHALVDGKKLRCVGGKQYSPYQVIQMHTDLIKKKRGERVKTN